ncbi:Uncharacterised protein [uncultured archaeon]|nr:Uncharacterised protein [uncultured archaeon]
MVLKFQYALYAIGAILILIGAGYVLLDMSKAEQDRSFFDSLSYGFASACGSIFSGVMIGVGAALIIDGLLFALPRRLYRVASALALAFIAIGMGFSIVADAKLVNYPSLVLFFSSVAFAAGMVVSTTVIGLGGLISRYVSAA